MNRHPNPFTPMFGRIPPFMAGRERVINGIERAFDSEAADPNLCSIFVGARGTGKTALLSYLSNAAGEYGWVSANVSAVPGMLDEIAGQAAVAARNFIEPPDRARLTSLSIGQVVGAEWEHLSPATETWRLRMTSIIQPLNEQGVGLLITVDEVRADVDEMIQFASAFQHFVREERKVALLMAGLPSHVSALVSNEAVSFFRRAKKHRLGRISDTEVAAALRKTIEDQGRSIEEEALRLAVSAINGFPYMMQLVGFQLWDEATGDTITGRNARDAVELARSDFEDSVLDATYRELSNGDLDFLLAMLADERESSIADIATRLDKSPSHARVYKGRLLEQGVIEEERRGHVKFALPYMREYLAERHS